MVTQIWMSSILDLILFPCNMGNQINLHHKYHPKFIIIFKIFFYIYVYAHPTHPPYKIILKIPPKKKKKKTIFWSIPSSSFELLPNSLSSSISANFLLLLDMDMGGKEKLEAFEAMELRELSWVIMKSGEDEVCEASISTMDSSSENSISSIESFSSELAEDASSSSTSNPSLSSFSPLSSSSGPLYELSELMANLPIK